MTLTSSQCNYLWRLSWLTLGSSIYSGYRGYYDLSLSSGVVFLTSINYWRNPDYSYRRYLDIVCVHSALALHLYRAYYASNYLPYYMINGLAMVSYPIAIYYYKKKHYWKSVISHGFVHIFANIANYFLYSGSI